jgi:hypothetical protein
MERFPCTENRYRVDRGQGHSWEYVNQLESNHKKELQEYAVIYDIPEWYYWIRCCKCGVLCPEAQSIRPKDASCPLVLVMQVQES